MVQTKPSLRERLLTKSLRSEVISVGGEPVRVRALTMAEAKVLRQHATDDLNVSDARLVVMGVIHEDGTQVFEQDDIPDIENNMSVTDVSAIANAIVRLSGLGAEPQAEVEERLRTDPFDKPNSA